MLANMGQPLKYFFLFIYKKSPQRIAEGFFHIRNLFILQLLKQLFSSQFKIIAAVHPGVAAARVVEGVL